MDFIAEHFTELVNIRDNLRASGEPWAKSVDMGEVFMILAMVAWANGRWDVALVSGNMGGLWIGMSS